MYFNLYEATLTIGIKLGSNVHFMGLCKFPLTPSPHIGPKVSKGSCKLLLSLGIDLSSIHRTHTFEISSKSTGPILSKLGFNNLKMFSFLQNCLTVLSSVKYGCHYWAIYIWYRNQLFNIYNLLKICKLSQIFTKLNQTCMAGAIMIIW